MVTASPFRGLCRVFSRTTQPRLAPRTPILPRSASPPQLRLQNQQQSQPISTSASLAAAAKPKPRASKANPNKKRKKKRGAEHPTETELRARIFRQTLHSPAPPPLRMARNRWLRHWTIHRAWMLHRRKTRESREAELYRAHQGMHNACEELRKTVWPAGRDVGYLYRVAMEKKGVWANGAVPIEYARAMTETRGHKVWDYEWRR